MVYGGIEGAIGIKVYGGTQLELQLARKAAYYPQKEAVNRFDLEPRVVVQDERQQFGGSWLYSDPRQGLLQRGEHGVGWALDLPMSQRSYRGHDALLHLGGSLVGKRKCENPAELLGGGQCKL
jgi:hypothetical protein